MRLYLDLCALKRPFDAPQEDRVLLEALAVASLLDKVETGKVEAVTSPVLELENSRNPDAERRVAVEDILARLKSPGYAGVGLGARAAELHALGFDPLDALHLAVPSMLGVSTSSHATTGSSVSPGVWSRA